MPEVDEPKPSQSVEDSSTSTPTLSPSGNRKIATAALVALVILVALVSYFAFQTKPKTTTNHTVGPARIAPGEVSISGANFNPSTIYVRVGQAVVWTNTDSAAHSLASDNPTPIFSSPKLNPNDSFSYVFNKAGTYPYHDNANTRLAGIVVVK